MRVLYILLHIGTFIAGYYDNGDLTAFAILCCFDIFILLDKLTSAKKK